MKPVGTGKRDWPQRLRELAAGIRQNVPASRNPEAFHERKSELESQAMCIADEIERQQQGGAR